MIDVFLILYLYILNAKLLKYIILIFIKAQCKRFLVLNVYIY